MKINKKHKLPLIILILIGMSTLIYTTTVVSKLEALGFSQNEALKISQNVLFDYSIIEEEKLKLENEIKALEEKASKEIGIPAVKNTNEDLKTQKEELQVFTQTKEKELLNDINENLKKVEEYQVEVEVAQEVISKTQNEIKENIKTVNEEKTLVAQKKEIESVIEMKEQELTTQIADLKMKNLELGKSAEDIQTLSDPSLMKTKNNLQESYDALVKAEYEANYDVVAAQQIFEVINAYRAENGLKAYTYNTEMQACLDEESKYYAETSNPHGWVCKSVANENAGMGRVGTDYVTPAIAWWKNSPSHNAPMLGDYSSIAVSSYILNGRTYIEIGFFN